MKLFFGGDVMLSREVGRKFGEKAYNLISSKCRDIVDSHDYSIFNLESPIHSLNASNDHLIFGADNKILKAVKFADIFITANNHINDCGAEGIESTLNYLRCEGFEQTGIYKDTYVPYLIESGKAKVAIVSLTDLMNEEFDSAYTCLRFEDSQEVNSCISTYRNKGYLVVVVAHVGQLFSRYPHPSIRSEINGYVESGAGLVLTIHPHVSGFMETIKGVPVYYSLGDFIMDGNSERRRHSYGLSVEILESRLVNIQEHGFRISKELATENNERYLVRRRLFGSLVLRTLPTRIYAKIYPLLYAFEIIRHNLSTIRFLYKKMGVVKIFRLLYLRKAEVWMMIRWALGMRRGGTKDTEAIKPNRKKITSEQLYE